MTFFSYQTQINLFIPNLEDFQKSSKKTQKIRNSNNKTLFFLNSFVERDVTKNLKESLKF